MGRDTRPIDTESKENNAAMDKTPPDLAAKLWTEDSDGNDEFPGRAQHGPEKLVPLELITPIKGVPEGCNETTMAIHNVGAKFSENLPADQRSSNHKALAGLLRELGETKGDGAVKAVVEDLNLFLKSQNSPYVFNIANMSNGQDFLSLRETSENGEKPKFRGTVEISEPRPLKPFLDAGEKFTEELSTAQRKEGHRELASHLRQLHETKGEDAVRDAVEKLNTKLELANSPYKFNTARMSNGQDFLSLRAKLDGFSKKIFLGTLEYSDPRQR